MCVCLSAYIASAIPSVVVFCFCGFVSSLHSLNCVFVGEIIVDVSHHKCHHVHTCDNDVHVPCNVL